MIKLNIKINKNNNNDNEESTISASTNYEKGKEKEKKLDEEKEHILKCKKTFIKCIRNNNEKDKLKDTLYVLTFVKFMSCLKILTVSSYLSFQNSLVASSSLYMLVDKSLILVSISSNFTDASTACYVNFLLISDAYVVDDDAFLLIISFTWFSISEKFITLSLAALLNTIFCASFLYPGIPNRASTLSPFL